MGRSVIMVWEYEEDEKIREELKRAFEVRFLCLDAVKQVSWYDEASLEEKNWLYDELKRRVVEMP